MKLKVSTVPRAILQFRKAVWAYYKKHGRHNLPWRKTKDPYKILVSEVMLQQTQVERVIPFYTKFIKKFPTAKKLVAAPLSDVLKNWQGLGYNRRAKMLQEAAKEMTARKIRTVSELEMLPGVGPYTAHAVATFAWNEDVVFVETNIRTAVIEHFFSDKQDVPESDIEEILYEALPEGKAREWYSALMDYGASLKRSGISHTVRSKTYAKQSAFAGSLREARGAILRELARGGASPNRLTGLLGAERRAQMRSALRALFTEGLVEKINESYMLAD